jgi:hypothetical protein
MKASDRLGPVLHATCVADSIGGKRTAHDPGPPLEKSFAREPCSSIKLGLALNGIPGADA